MRAIEYLNVRIFDRKTIRLTKSMPLKPPLRKILRMNSDFITFTDSVFNTLSDERKKMVPKKLFFLNPKLIK